MRDSLPEASIGFRSILLQISFVNQAFLALQFFQVQGRSLEFPVEKLGLALIQYNVFSSNNKVAVINGLISEICFTYLGN